MAWTARCHCGATEIRLERLPQTARECNCSFCARTGAIWGYYPPQAVQVLRAEADKVYSASDDINRHHFCSSCGMQTWGDSPDWNSAYTIDGSPKAGFDPTTIPADRVYAVNLRLIDDLDWSQIAVEKVEGRTAW